MFPHRIVTTLPSLLPIIHENEEVVPPAIPRLVAPTIPPPSYRRGGAEVDGLWFDGNAFAAVADYLNNQEQGLLSSPGYARSFYTSKSDYGGVAMDQTLPARPYEDYDDDEPPRVRFLDRWGWRKVVFATVGFILFLLVLGLGTGYALRNRWVVFFAFLFCQWLKTVPLTFASSEQRPHDSRSTGRGPVPWKST